MHLAILVTNTDLSDFAHRHPFDGEKFTTLIHAVRPDWKCSVFLVHQDEFPTDLSVFDGIMITGSPASVHDTDPWVVRLLELIRGTNLPIYGACYGHQAIALALGGTVGPNPNGWRFGLETCLITAPQSWMVGLDGQHRQFAAHNEQVLTLPPNAQAVSTAEDVPYAGFVIGNRIYTSQNHPEMTRDFFTALLEEYSAALGPDVTSRAQASLAHADDYVAYAETIAAFFEQAVN